MAQLENLSIDGLTANDMVFVAYDDGNGVALCHYAIVNFGDRDIKQFDTEAEAEAEFLAAVEAGRKPRGSYSHEVLNR